MEKKQLDRLAKQLNLAEAYKAIVDCSGWEQIKEVWRKEAELVGKAAVSGAIKKEVLEERLLEARLLLNRIRLIEVQAEKFENLKNQLEIATK